MSPGRPGSGRTVDVAVAAPHPAAVAAARDAVAAGGGAVAAALAAAVTLTVVYPHQCSLGGDLVALVRAPDGRVTAVLSIGAAAGAVDVARLRALGGGRMPGQGAHAVTVPGVVAGWRALDGWGGGPGTRGDGGLGLRWGGGLGPALARAARLAEQGATVSTGLARAIRSRWEQVLADPGLRSVFTRDGAPLNAGEPLVQPQLAGLLRELASDPDSFYRGAVAADLAEGLRRAGGTLTAADLAAHDAETAVPLNLTTDTASWWATPPPSQGATLLALLDLRTDDDPVRLVRAATAARDRLLGDPRRGPVDLSGLLLRDGATTPVVPALSRRAAGDTVAVTAVDSDGYAVSLIQSVYQTFGAGVLDPGTGIVLHNRGSAFSLDDGHPALIGPGLRPPHTLCPLLGRSADVLLAVGCQGGRAQPQILAATSPDLLDARVAPQAVLDRPRWVVGARDLGFDRETVLAEPGALTAPSDGLPVAVTAGPVDDAGHVQVARLAAGHLEAASDPRADGLGAILNGPQENPS
ncbi:Gamma-glutamyltransferase [Actinobacteria bacterium OK074]|nr:Gamma-glutamyltransferase [Actinobacteria bacterium OK074]